MQQSERERHDPWVVLYETRMAVALLGKFAREEQDAQCDHCFNGRLRNMYPAERGRPKRHAVREGERGNRLYQQPPVWDD